jgi:hypothetical protein
MMTIVCGFCACVEGGADPLFGPVLRGLFWREHGAGEVDVFLGTFDEPSRLPRPKYAIWAAHRVPWLPDLDGVPTFPARRPT